MSYPRSRTPTPSTARTTARSPSAGAAGTKFDKPRVHLLDTCYICGNNFSKAVVVIDHVRRIHGYDLPRRRQGYKRPQNKNAEYVRDKNGEWDYQDLACPSCWFHCPEEELRELNQHTRDTHDPIKVDISKDDDDGYISAGSGGRNRRERSGTPGVRIREGSAGSIDDAAKEISTKLEEITKIFKSLFNI
jgi:Pyruvate/2-oxoacid:ferredoxin oxidoreductase delta subunit